MGYIRRPPFPIANHSAMSKRQRGEGVNSLTPIQINNIAAELLSKGAVFKIVRGDREFFQCSLAATKDAKGNPKHPQCTITRHAPLPDGQQHKQLVHLIWYRYVNEGATIPEDLHFSHLDADPRTLHLTAESPQANESRKYCHLFGWYKTKPGEDRPRCPHWETPCTGP